MKHALILLFATATLFAGTASAATIIARTDVELTRMSDAVVVATLQSKAVELGPDGNPMTRNRLAVREWWTGEGAATIDVLQYGGQWQGKTYQLSGDYSLDVGDTVVIFLQKAPFGLVSTLLSWSVYDVAGEGPVAPISRHGADMGLMRRNERGVLAPASPDSVKPAKTLGVLKKRVLDAAKGGAK